MKLSGDDPLDLRPDSTSVRPRVAFDVVEPQGRRLGFVVELPDLAERHGNSFVAFVMTGEIGTMFVEFVGFYPDPRSAVDAVKESES